MKRVIISLGIIGVVAAIAIGTTIAYFNDVETSTGNTFSAGEIDLKIDLQCDRVGCGFPLKDLNYDPLFYYCDIKPGDSHNTTISFHVYNNDAWGRIAIEGLKNYEYGCTEPEAVVDGTCASPGDYDGELAQNLYFSVWLDEGNIVGWQCPENVPHCAADPKEGNNQFDGIETKLVEHVRLSDMPSEVVFPDVIMASRTYYVGVNWTVPGDVGNIIQTDSINGIIKLEVVQAKNNPWPPQF